MINRVSEPALYVSSPSSCVINLEIFGIEIRLSIAVDALKD